jgi:hypothetical protein
VRFRSGRFLAAKVSLGAAGFINWPEGFSVHVKQLGRALWKARLRWQRNALFVERMTVLANIGVELAKSGHQHFRCGF